MQINSFYTTRADLDPLSPESGQLISRISAAPAGSGTRHLPHSLSFPATPAKSPGRGTGSIVFYRTMLFKIHPNGVFFKSTSILFYLDNRFFPPKTMIGRKSAQNDDAEAAAVSLERPRAPLGRTCCSRAGRLGVVGTHGKSETLCIVPPEKSGPISCFYSFSEIPELFSCADYPDCTCPPILQFRHVPDSIPPIHEMHDKSNPSRIPRRCRSDLPDIFPRPEPRWKH